MKIKKGDTVQVLSGKDRGLRGKVIVAYPDSDRVIVEGANRVKKHTKQQQTARGSQTGGIVETEAPIHVSNVGFIHPETGKPGRLGYRIDEEGNKVRVVRSGGSEVDVK
jgi:large subunit ribosomal protein L24